MGPSPCKSPSADDTPIPNRQDAITNQSSCYFFFFLFLPLPNIAQESFKISRKGVTFQFFFLFFFFCVTYIVSSASHLPSDLSLARVLFFFFRYFRDSVPFTLLPVCLFRL